MKKRPEVAEFVKTLKTVQRRRKLSFDQILKGIQNDTLFGLLIVDIHTPTEPDKVQPQTSTWCRVETVETLAN